MSNEPIFKNEDIADNTADILDLNQSDVNSLEENYEILSPTINSERNQSEVLSNYEDEILEKKQLDNATITNGLSNLGKTPDGLTYAMLNLKLVGMKIENASVLGDYCHLQSVDLSYNNLIDCQFIESMHNLIVLKLAHNQLGKMFENVSALLCGEFLREVDFSFNRIDELPDFSGFYFLSKINLESNNLTEINALSQCYRLTHLNIAHNSLETLEPLMNCPLRYLNAGYNQLVQLTGLEQSYRLQNLIVAGNNLKSIEIFNESHSALFHLDLESNYIVDMEHLRPLQHLILLRELNLRHNPIVEVPDYRLRVLLLLQKLTLLDSSKVEITEKVRAENIFCPNLDVSAARDHRINMVNRYFKAQTVLYSTLQNSYTPYPMLVLVGPKGSGKKSLARKLVHEIPNFFGLALSHTDNLSRKLSRNTKPLQQHHQQQQQQQLDQDTEDEDNKMQLDTSDKADDYIYVTTEQFDSMRMKGRFLETCQIDGNQYGLTVDAVEDIAKEGLACVIDMELEGVKSLKKTHFEPRYVLIMCLDPIIQESRIRNKATYPVGLDRIVKNSLNRTDMYLEVHQNNPGFFDKFICSDNLDDAYINLKRLIMDYLGITNEFVSDTRTLDAHSRLASIGNLTQSRATESQPKNSSGESACSNRAASNGVDIPQDGQTPMDIEQISLQRRFSTAKAAIFRRNNDDSNYNLTKQIPRAKSHNAAEHRLHNCDYDNDADSSSQMSNHHLDLDCSNCRADYDQRADEIVDHQSNPNEEIPSLFSNAPSASTECSIPPHHHPRQIQT